MFDRGQAACAHRRRGRACMLAVVVALLSCRVDAETDDRDAGAPDDVAPRAARPGQATQQRARPPGPGPVGSTPAESRHTVVFDDHDDGVRHSLATASIAGVQLGRGGRSVKFKVTLGDGTVGYFKPEQTYAAHWYSELAAFYIDRALGLGRVPPTIGRIVPWSRLRTVARWSRHRDEIVVQRSGHVRGSFQWWVPVPLMPVTLPRGWEGWLSIDAPPAVSPFQRASSYRRAVTRHERSKSSRPAASSLTPDGALAAALSDLVLFDYLIGNTDRWGGRFTNVRTLGRGGPLVFIDNANGFHRGRTPSRRERAQLAAVQRMRARTIEAIRGLRTSDLRRVLGRDPLAPVLSDARLAELERRRLDILAHADAMKARFGESATPW